MSKNALLVFLASIALGSAVLSAQPGPRVIVEAAMSDGALQYVVQGGDTPRGGLLDSLGAPWQPVKS